MMRKGTLTLRPQTRCTLCGVVTTKAEMLL